MTCKKKLSTTEGAQANEIIADLIKNDLDRFKKEAVRAPLKKNILLNIHIKQCLLLKRFLALIIDKTKKEKD